MASVFLSYAREDVGVAGALARALEASGHSVWWDRHIKGGAQFASVIETALNAADKIVVLWSVHSVSSAWVRDEAAVGRDTGRLVPVTIDGTAAPLGFRQFQTVDLARWKAPYKSEALDMLIEAVGPTSCTISAQGSPLPSRVRRAGSRWLLPAFVAALAALLGGGWWWASRSGAHTPIVAINSVSGSYASRKIARELTIRLGDLQSARSDAFQLIPDGGNRADLILQIDADDGPRLLRRDLSIMAGGNRSILWSTSLQQAPDKVGELSQQLTLTSERVLSCALDALADHRDRIDVLVLKQYLNGCARLEQVYGGNANYDPELITQFVQVTANAPHLEGAWAKLLTVEAEIARSPDPPPRLIADLRDHIEQSEKLGLRLGEMFAAKASLVAQSDFKKVLSVYDEGIAANPNNALLLRLRAEQLQRVGRMSDAIYDSGAALDLDPLSPALQDNYVSALAYAGKIETAYAQLRKAEAMWPGASNIKFARYRLDLRFGDPKEALSIYRSGSVGPIDPAQEAFILARIDPTPANVEHAINEERIQYAQEPRYIAGILQALAQFGHEDEAIDLMLHYPRPDAIGYNAEVMFRPALRDVWRDPRSMAAAAHLGFLRYWAGTGKWPDFCSDPQLPYDCKKEAAKLPS